MATAETAAAANPWARAFEFVASDQFRDKFGSGNGEIANWVFACGEDRAEFVIKKTETKSTSEQAPRTHAFSADLGKPRRSVMYSIDAMYAAVRKMFPDNDQWPATPTADVVGFKYTFAADGAQDEFETTLAKLSAIIDEYAQTDPTDREMRSIQKQYAAIIAGIAALATTAPKKRAPPKKKTQPPPAADEEEPAADESQPAEEPAPPSKPSAKSARGKKPAPTPAAETDDETPAFTVPQKPNPRKRKGAEVPATPAEEPPAHDTKRRKKTAPAETNGVEAHVTEAAVQEMARILAAIDARTSKMETTIARLTRRAQVSYKEDTPPGDDTSSDYEMSDAEEKSDDASDVESDAAEACDDDDDEFVDHPSVKAELARNAARKTDPYEGRAFDEDNCSGMDTSGESDEERTDSRSNGMSGAKVVDDDGATMYSAPATRAAKPKEQAVVLRSLLGCITKPVTAAKKPAAAEPAPTKAPALKPPVAGKKPATKPVAEKPAAAEPVVAQKPPSKKPAAKPVAEKPVAAEPAAAQKPPSKKPAAPKKPAPAPKTPAVAPAKPSALPMPSEIEQEEGDDELENLLDDVPDDSIVTALEI